MYKQYNTMSDALVLNLDFTIPNNHEARFISFFVDSMPFDTLLPQPAHTGRPAFHPAMLLKMILFAYSRKVTSGRAIQQLNEESIPMKWLSGNCPVSYKTLNNFRSNSHTSHLIKTAFICFAQLLRDHHLLDDDALFVDGTKLQADANIYSFTWKKAIERYQRSLNDKLDQLYDQLIQDQVDVAISQEALHTSDGIETLIQALDASLEAVDDAIEAEPTVIKGGSPNKQRRRRLKKYYRQCRQDYLPRQQRYESAQKTFNGRNSFSKTDHDATFMCMKEDPMKNRELKPGYNLQIATNKQYVIDFQLFSNPTDMRTLLPFLREIPMLNHFHTIVADAGYGSQENYEGLVDELEKVPLIPYALYRKEQTRKYRTDMTRRENWTYVADGDYYIDHQGVRFGYYRHTVKEDRYGYVRTTKLYVANKEQGSDDLNVLAKTPSGQQRRMSVNMEWEYFKHQIKAHLESDEGQRLYARRQIDVETVFGRLKGVFGMRRVHVRGKQAVYNDVGLMLMAMNLTKLAGYIKKAFCFFMLETQKNAGIFRKYRNITAFCFGY